MPASDPTELSRRTLDDEITVISIRGELDTYATRQLATAFAAAVSDRTMQVIVDLSAVPFMTSAALAMFVMHAQAIDRAGGQFVLAEAQPRVLETFKLAGFQNYLRHYETVDQAVDALRTPPGSHPADGDPPADAGPTAGDPPHTTI